MKPGERRWRISSRSFVPPRNKNRAAPGGSDPLEYRRVIPKLPFASDLTPERELAEFEKLKPRLKEVWDSISMRDEEPHTSVVVPSLTLDQSELQKLEGSSFYEERLLFLLIRLRNPRARIVFVTSQPVHPLVLEYYFQLLVGIPASHARSRLTLLCAYDDSPRSLTEKILERPRLIERIRAGIGDPSRAYLTVFNSTPLERKLAVLLGIPLNGVDPALRHLGTKSGSRKVFREAGVAPSGGLRGPPHAPRRRGGAPRAPPRAARACERPSSSSTTASRGRATPSSATPTGSTATPSGRRWSGSSTPCRGRRTSTTSPGSSGWGGSSRSSSRATTRPRRASSSASTRTGPSSRSRPTTRSSAGRAGRSSSAASSPPRASTG